MHAAVHGEKPLRHKERISKRKLIKWLAVALLIIVAASVGYRCWRHAELYVSTDNAHLNTNTVEIAAQISGQVIRVYVRDNQPVKAGDPLFDIDPQPYLLALDKAQAAANQTQLAQPNVPLFALISNQEYWADADFKETELERIRPDQAATISVDMYPDHLFHGVVESLGGGAGTVFSLLPPLNATGNWVKVTQRVPVQVRITDPDPAYQLRIGTTATVEVALGNGP